MLCILNVELFAIGHAHWTRDIEVLIDSVNVLNEAAKDLPFSTADLSVSVSM